MTISDRFWREIKQNAQKRHLLFSITPEQAWKKFLLQNRRCVFTGVELDFDSLGYKGTASLDRIDNDKPYFPHNVQWVFAPVNIMRGCHNIIYFKKLCEMVANHTALKE